MKKAIIITYYWPPSGGAGVQRWLKFVKYLRDFGWEPIVFCPENPEYPEFDSSLLRDVPPGLEVIRYPIWEPYNAYKKLLGQKKEEKINAAFLSEKKKNRTLENISVWIRGNFFIPDARKYWIRPSVRFLKTYLSSHHVDALISTGPPHSTHLIARPLAAHFGLPWLADFRDPWTNIDFYKDLKLSDRADRKHRRMELGVLRNASVVTVISKSMADDFAKILNRNYEVITNGYDHEDTSHTLKIDPDQKFSIAHIGTLVSTRNPIALWIALRDLVKEVDGFARQLEIKLVGKVDLSVRNSVTEYGLEPYLRKIDYMPHDEVIREQQRSQVLLLIINNTPNSKMILTGKFFEYLAARRPILCIGPPEGDAAAILRETNAGLLADYDDHETLKSNIRHFFQAYRAGTLNVDSREIGKYSRKELTASLAGVMQQMIEPSANNQ